MDPYYEENGIILNYGGLPQYHYYSDAVLHMRKDGENLEMWMDDFQNDINRYNSLVTAANQHINNRISAMLGVAFNSNDPSQVQRMNETNGMTRLILKRDIFKAQDVYDAAMAYNSAMTAYGVDSSIRDRVLEIIRDPEIINRMSTMKGFENVLRAEATGIRFKSDKVLRSILDESYETRVDCCPTYWSLLKRFV